MAYMILKTILVLLVVQTLVRLLRSERARRHGKGKIDASNCKPVTKCNSWDPLFGLDNFVRLRSANARGRLSQFHRELHNIHGPTFRINVLGQPQIQTADPENIQAICTTSFEDWGVGPMRGGIGKPFIERGIFTDDGAFWKHSRSLIRPTFSRTEIANLGNFEQHVQRLLKLIPSDGSTVDLLPLLKRLFLDASTEFIFGKSVESLLPETPFETDEFMKAFDRSLLGLALLLVFGPLRWPLYLDPWWRAASSKVHNFVDKQVAAVLKRRERTIAENKKSGGGEQSDGAKLGNDEITRHERYILLEGMAEVTQDPYDLRMQVINAFFPARDTAAIAFGDMLFSLARHPAVWQQLRTEVLELGEIDTMQLTYEVVRSQKIVRAIVSESLRLHPAASRIGRTSLRDTTLPRGGGSLGDAPIFVPAGTPIEMDLYSLQRDPAIWGPDADTFRPSRWLPDASGRQRPLWEAHWQYEPFLGGIRMCPAQNMVVTQLSYLLIRFAQEYAVLDNRDPVLEYIEEVTMTVASRNGVKVGLSRSS